jgi:hypothetical protein
VTKTQTAAAALASMVDELGDLEQETAPYKAKIARAEVIRAAIRGTYKDASPAGSYQAHGERWSTLIGPMGNQSVVDTAALYKLAGPKLFLEMASVTLGAITEKGSAALLGAVVSVAMSGPRKLSTIPAAPGQVKTARERNGRENA